MELFLCISNLNKRATYYNAHHTDGQIDRNGDPVHDSHVQRLVSEYEQMRLRNIARNQRKLDELGLTSC